MDIDPWAGNSPRKRDTRIQPTRHEEMMPNSAKARSSSKDWFQSFARWTSNAAGKPLAFGLSVAVIIVWAASGPLFHFSDTWQLVINTGTTVVTFWMVFVIQSSQNNDTHALQLKLDELIRATDAARNVFLGCEGLPEDAIREFQEEFNTLQRRARQRGRAAALSVDKTPG